MRVLFLLLTALLMVIASALSAEKRAVKPVCEDGANPVCCTGKIEDFGVMTGCSAFSEDNKDCKHPENLFCCVTLFDYIIDRIATQCEGVKIPMCRPRWRTLKRTPKKKGFCLQKPSRLQTQTPSQSSAFAATEQPESSDVGSSWDPVSLTAESLSTSGADIPSFITSEGGESTMFDDLSLSDSVYG